MKIRKYLLFSSIILVCVIWASCEQMVLAPDPQATPEQIFNHLWEDVNDRYAYFELKDLDWQKVKEDYSSQITRRMDRRELFDVLSDMLYELQDGHVNLSSSFDRSRNWEWFQGFPINYNDDLIQEHYLGTHYWISGPLHNQILDDVLYVNYRSFADRISDGNLQALMERAQGLKGVIIDVRNNGGGNLHNAYQLASCFTDQPHDFAKRRTKNGPGPNDFSPWKTLSLRVKEGLQFHGNVVVLTNRKSYSATTFFSQMMKTLPNVLLMGDQSGGGGGIPVFRELPNGWVYRFSATQTLDLEGNHLESGVEVDVPINLRRGDEIRGRDTIIEAALHYLRNP